MANNDISWTDIWFNWAVRALYEVASWLGMTYEEINVWLFMVVWPVATLALVVIILYQWKQNRQLKGLTNSNGAGITRCY